MSSYDEACVVPQQPGDDQPWHRAGEQREDHGHADRLGQRQAEHADQHRGQRLQGEQMGR